MKLGNVIEGGLTGAGTLGLLQEALHKFDSSTPRPLLYNSGLLKKLKKNGGKNGMKSTKLYIQLATELLSNAALFGLSGVGKRKNAVLRGALLGAGTGLASAFLNNGHANGNGKEHMNGHAQPVLNEHGEALETKKNAKGSELKNKLMTVALYSAGGLIAGLAVKKIGGKKAKKTLKRLGKKIKLG